MSANLTIQTANTANGISIAYDYSPYFERIATALENISLNSNEVVSNITILTTAATGNGIHMLSPYSWIPMVNMYKSLVEQGGILATQDANPNVDAATQAAALAELNNYLNKVRSFPII